jgi:hypothetical protein
MVMVGLALQSDSSWSCSPWALLVCMVIDFMGFVGVDGHVLLGFVGVDGCAFLGFVGVPNRCSPRFC